MNIGNWVRRAGGKWHIVESVVANDAVTKCGRRMDRVTKGGELEVSELMPLTRMIGQPHLCRTCDDNVSTDRAALECEIAKHSTTPSEDFVRLASTMGADISEDDPSVGQVDPT